jgi:hypothetical protein
MINMLATCNLYLRNKLEIVDKRNAKSAGRVQRFAVLTTDMLLANPENYEDLLDADDEAADPDYGTEEDAKEE